MDFSNLGNEIFGHLPCHSTERPLTHAAHEFIGETWATYKQYLGTDHWRTTRVACLRRFEFQCALCSFGGKLDVHHRTYERLGRELPEDLIPLCRRCHDRHHEEFPAWGA
jgi:5-methylcytosine-specific restriction endonuclease McrA